MYCRFYLFINAKIYSRETVLGIGRKHVAGSPSGFHREQRAVSASVSTADGRSAKKAAENLYLQL